MSDAAGADVGATEDIDDVFRVYGAVMRTVQWWERTLALLWWRALLTPSDRREAESKASAKAVARLEHAFSKVTAAQAAKELDGLPPELSEEVGELLPHRNRLAHRFLLEHEHAGAFKHGTLRQLAEYGGRFDAATRALMDQLDTTAGYTGEVRDHWPALAQKIEDRLWAGQPVDYADALERSTGADETPERP